LIQNVDTIPLGKTGIQIVPLGLGAWSWGDPFVWGYGFSGYNDDDIWSAFRTSMEAGVNFIDTAEWYGIGRSEKLLGAFIKKFDKPLIIATKFMPYPWRFSKTSLLHTLRQSLDRLQMDQIDLYQIHFPSPPMAIEHWVEAMAEAVQQGLVRAVGVSNYSEAQMRRAYTVLARHDIPLASNQMQYNLLNRKIEYNGLLKVCQELGVTLIAYSPMAKGVLTGKYTPQKPPPGPRRFQYHSEFLRKIQPLFNLMRDIGLAHEGKTLTQVALNWVICKGAVPIPGAKKASQAQENCGALGWRLSDEEITTLDVASGPFSK
jgi:aryl-alcohol dehydrogenase-like predicted oxidoreductase